MFFRTILTTLLLASYVSAQTVETIPPGEDKIQHLPKGLQAPYEGMLFDNDTALRWANWLKQYKFRLAYDVETEQERCTVKLQGEETKLKLHVEAHDLLEKDLRERVLKLEKENLKLADVIKNQPWYQSRDFGIVVGVVGTLGLGVLGVVIVDKVRD